MNMIHKLTEEEIAARVERAKGLFRQGFNCSQSVFAACADLYGIEDESLALRLGASFGGGIGRMRETCGAACGMFLLAGLENGSATADDAEGKKNNYALVQRLAGDFKQEHGSLVCAELLGLVPRREEIAGTSVAASRGENGSPVSHGENTSESPTLHGQGMIGDPTPAPRTDEYYKKRPCVEMVGNAVRMYLNTVSTM